MMLVEMAEWQTRLIPEVILTDEDRRLVERLHRIGGRITIDELRDGVRIQSKAWVGVLNFTEFTVQIVPKLAGAHEGLVRMLTFTSGLQGLRPERAIRHLDIVPKAPLFDLIALLFTEACEPVIRRGLLHDYRTVEDDLPVLRGRLRVAEQVRGRYGQLQRLECRFDEYLSDIRENQLLAAALLVCRSRVRDMRIRGRVMRQHSVLASACPNRLPPVSVLCESFDYHRLNQHYEPAHVLAQMILQFAGVEDLLAIGRTQSFAFLLNMNNLFEAFVGKLFERLVGSELTVRTQFSMSSIIIDKRTQKSYGSVRPDVVLQLGDQRLAVDAKYKKYDEKKISAADIYQTFLYAYAFEHEPPTALIVYPAAGSQLRQTDLAVRTIHGLRGADISAVGIPIVRILDELDERVDLEHCIYLQRTVTERMW